VKDQGGGKAGIWGTFALANGIVYADTNAGRVLGIDQMTGQVLWEKRLGSQTWQSPVVVDNTLIVGDCEGNLNAWDVTNPTVDPPLKWTVKLSGCIEATPTVWKGRIFVATRGGQFYALGDQ
jgi:outer membrane protein assembly factor BamB